MARAVEPTPCPECAHAMRESVRTYGARTRRPVYFVDLFCDWCGHSIPDTVGGT